MASESATHFGCSLVWSVCLSVTYFLNFLMQRYGEKMILPNNYLKKFWILTNKVSYLTQNAETLINLTNICA